MSSSYAFTFPIKVGMHARPASMLQGLAHLHSCSFTFLNERSQRQADLGSVMALMSTDTRQGDPCRIHVEGGDVQAALEAVKKLILERFAKLNAASEEELAANAPAEVVLPRAILQSGESCLRGESVSKGIVAAKAYGIAPVVDSRKIEEGPASANELDSFNAAVVRVVSDYQDKLATLKDSLERQIIETHLSILRDPEYLDRVRAGIAHDKLSARASIRQTTDYYSGILSESVNVYLKERVVDIQDVAHRLLIEICGEGMPRLTIELREPSIVIARLLTPSMFLSLDKHFLKGLILEKSGATSHVAIMARSSAIPCAINMAGIMDSVATGDEIILDANRGIVFRNPGKAIREYYDREGARYYKKNEQLKKKALLPAMTRCGRSIDVAANVTSADDVKSAFENGAQGVGLFRTEMLFMGRAVPPTEEEQFEIYLKTAMMAGDRSVIIRTLDIGGDKPLPYLNLPSEDNPFLGYRGARIYKEFEGLLRTQLRAIMRASWFGNVKIMFPMISSVEEIRRLNGIVREVQMELRGDVVRSGLEVGVMVEVPSAALIIDQLSVEVDFFSVGTNDLAQYFMAVDRNNKRVADLYNYLHPSFLRLLKKIVDDAHAHHKWVGICGEMGSHEKSLPLLLGLGFDEISAPFSQIAALKSAMSEKTVDDCARLVSEATSRSTVEEVRELLSAFETAHHIGAIVSEKLVVLESNASTKEEAIQELAGVLDDADRLTDYDVVENAIWKREEVCSTAVGHGIAVPHCKSHAIKSNSVAVLRLKAPIDWGSPDGEKVDTLFLFAITAEGYEKDHQRLIAKLSRRLMHPKFRNDLCEGKDPAQMAVLLKECLEA